jgi:hypothetical protein
MWKFRELECNVHDVVYFCAVRWLSRAKCLENFFRLRLQIYEYCAGKGMEFKLLINTTWVADLAFLTDVMSHLAVLNVNLQRKSMLVNHYYDCIKGFTLKLELLKNHMGLLNLTHFPNLKMFTPLSQDQIFFFQSEIETILYNFKSRFNEIHLYYDNIKIFANPYDVDPSTSPIGFDLELIELQTDLSLKSRYMFMDLISFYRSNISEDRFPRLYENGLKIVSLFGSTYRCESLFSRLNHIKDCKRTRTSDELLIGQLRLSTTAYIPDYSKISNTKQFQPSH